MVDGEVLAISGGGDFNAGGVVAVGNDNIGGFVSNIVPGVDGDTSTTGIDTLGGFDGLDTIGVGDHVNREVSIGVVGIDVDVGITATYAIHFDTGRNTPWSDIGACLTPDGAGEGGDISCGADIGLNTVAEVQVSTAGGSFPAQTGVQSIKSVEVTILDGDL